MKRPTLAINNREPVRSDSEVAKDIHSSDVREGRYREVLSRRISLAEQLY